MNSNNKFIKLIKKYSSVLLIVLAVFICLFSVIMGNVYVQSMRRSLWKQIVSDITEVTYQGSRTFETYIEQEEETLSVFSYNLSKLKFKTEEDNKNVIDLLNLYANDKSFYSLIVYGENDEVKIYIAGDNTPIIGEKSNYENYGASGITEPYINNYTGQKTIGYYKRIEFADGTKAILRKGQLMSDITDKFSLSFYNDTGFSYIVNRDGDIMIRPTHKNSNRTGTNIFNILEYSDKAKDESKILKQALSDNKVGAILSTEGSEDRVIAFVPINDIKDWYIISVIPNASISQNVEEILRSTTAIIIIVISIIIIFVLFLVTIYLFRKKSIAQIAEVKYREQLFGILANNTDEVFIMVSYGKNNIEYISSNISRVMGFEVEDIKNDVYALGKPNGNNTFGVLDKINELENGESIVYDSERTHAKTKEIHYFKEMAYRVSIDGVDKVIIIYSDRTSEKKSEIALVNAMESSIAANKAKSSFLSSMSHDIRTPMNAILGMATIASKDPNIAENCSYYIDKILTSGQHLLTLINDILDIAKIESGKMIITPSKFSIVESMEGLRSIVEQTAQEKNIYITIDYSNIEYSYIFADKVRIEQVFLNLLSNAIKYTPSGGRVNTSLVGVCNDENKMHLTFIVEDSGIGMSKEFMKKMYDSFSRVEDSRISEIQGTGLGLSIVKQIVDLMGGTIDCKSKEGVGTKFTVQFDFDIADNQETNQEVAIDIMSLEGLNILVAEDNDLNYVVISKYLEICKMNCSRVSDGQECIEHLESFETVPYDLILMDVQMPRLNGKEATKRLRKHNRKDIQNIPIIAMTADAFAEDVADCLACGMDGHISKPIDIGKLQHEIDRVLKETQKEQLNIVVSKKEETNNENTEKPIEDEEIFSYNKLYKLFESDDTVKQVLEVFLSSHKDDCEKLGELIKDNNYQEMRSILHNLIGVAGSFCLNKLYEASKQLRLEVHAEKIESFGEFAKIWEETINKVESVCKELNNKKN